MPKEKKVEELKMAQITDKELAAVADLLNLEQTLATKFAYYAQCSTDSAVKTRFENMAEKHRKHCDELYANLH